jgi:hypothetical protein
MFTREENHITAVIMSKNDEPNYDPRTKGLNSFKGRTVIETNVTLGIINWVYVMNTLPFEIRVEVTIDGSRVGSITSSPMAKSQGNCGYPYTKDTIMEAHVYSGLTGEIIESIIVRYKYENN